MADGQKKKKKKKRNRNHELHPDLKRHMHALSKGPAPS
jgi:hypothetical protein